VSQRGRLTPLQSSVLQAFFGAEHEFFLSGGAALVGFHLYHRETSDLDLFTQSAEAFERARIVLPNIVATIGGSLTVRQDSPGFRRVVVQRGDDELVVDLVRDIGPQLHAKTLIAGILVDPIEEIFSNKLTTLVSRQELRDLVDVLELERRGLQTEAFLAEANAKDGGCTPATLAFLLSQWLIPDDAKVPSGYTVNEVRAFKDALAERLVVVAHPGKV
jgi:predicted nucleotidyltransferase component of viral defense system